MTNTLDEIMVLLATENQYGIKDHFERQNQPHLGRER